MSFLLDFVLKRVHVKAKVRSYIASPRGSSVVEITACVYIQKGSAY